MVGEFFVGRVGGDSRVFKAPLQSQVEEFSILLGSEPVNAAQLPSVEQNPAVGIKDLGHPESVLDVFRITYRPMVAENNRVRLMDERDNCLGEFLSSGTLVGRQRDLAEKHFWLGKNAHRNRLTGDGKRSRVRRVAMDDRPDVGPLAIDFQMKQDFASAAFIARELISLEVNCAKVVWLKKAFAVQGRGAKDFIFG